MIALLSYIAISLCSIFFFKVKFNFRVMFFIFIGMFFIRDSMVLAFFLSTFAISSEIDLQTKEVPHTLYLIQVVTGIYYASMHNRLGIVLFLAAIVCAEIILRRTNGIGGADLKLYAVMLLYFAYMPFLIFLIVNFIVDLLLLLYFKIKGANSVAYVPLMYITCLGTIFIIRYIILS